MRLTEESIEAKIKSVEYLVKDLEEGPRLTLAFITMKNGFVATGQSACASPANYVKETGQHIAYENAFDKLWEVEGYLLKERIYQGETE